MTPPEVVLLREDGTPCGTALKETVHSASTPLHLAFSCHVQDSAGRLLITRRALTKATWPGVWTNAFCGHPRPGESFDDAIARHARSELGITVTDVSVAISDFRYRATDASGVVENEICPVFMARTEGPLHPHPEEVAEYAWAEPAALRAALTAAPWAFSPWLVLHRERLAILKTPAQDGTPC